MKEIRRKLALILASGMMLGTAVPAFAETACEMMTWGDLQTAEVVRRRSGS